METMAKFGKARKISRLVKTRKMRETKKAERFQVNVRQTLRVKKEESKKLKKSGRILVFCGREDAKKALNAGAHHIGNERTVAKILDEGWDDFDIVIAKSDMVPVVEKVRPQLEARGIMPSEENGAITDNVASAVNAVKAGAMKHLLRR